MRKQRTAAEDKKEERKVKFTDRLPPAASKRSGCKATYIQVTGSASDIMYRGHKPTTKDVIPENEIRGLQTSKDYVFPSFSPSHGQWEDLSRHPSFAETPAAACLNLIAIVKPCHCNDSATRSTASELF